MSGLRACNGVGLRDGSAGGRAGEDREARRRQGGMPPAAGGREAAGGEAMALVADWQRLCHDLRTPLNAILGNAELLLDGSAGPLSGEARACLGDIQLAGQRLMRHVGSLLELHRARSTPPPAGEAPVDLLELLRQATVAGPADAPEVMIEGLPGAARCVVRGDPGWLAMLAAALVELYLDEGAGRGPLRVAVGPRELERPTCLRLSWVDLDPQQLTALPLALIAAILDLHEGDLRVGTDGLRLDWPAWRVVCAPPALPGVPACRDGA